MSLGPRAAALLLGVAALAAAWIGPVHDLAERLFTGRMTRHVLVVAVAAPLLALALAPRLAGTRAGAALASAPVLLAAVEFAVMWGWHLPAAQSWARPPLGLAAEQGSFLAASLALWLGALLPGAALAGAGGLLLTSMHMTLLGALLTLAPRPLFEGCGGALGLTPLADQALGGTLMLAVGPLVYLAGGVWLAARALRGEGLAPVEGAR